MHFDSVPGGMLRRSFAPALTLLLVLLAPAAAHAAEEATLTPATPFSFGNREAGAGPSGARAYTVTSTGSDPLDVTAVALTGADAEHFAVTEDACSDAAPLATGGSCRILVAFDPAATGARSATLHVTTHGPVLTSGALSGTGRDLAVSVAAHDFGKVRVGELSAPLVVTFTNQDAEPYTPGALTATGFRIEGHDCTAPLALGASCSATLAFAPTRLGPVAGSLAIGGYGPAPVVLTGEGAQPASAIAPASHEFGQRAPAAGASPARPFVVRNTGNEPLEIGAVSLEGTGYVRAPDAAAPGGFALASDTCSGQTVAPGQTCSVGVAFAPVEPGWRAVLLRVPTDAGGPELVARVSGRGAGAGIDSEPLRPLELAGQPLVRLQGDGDDGLGSSLAATPCDVDGDGIDDVVAGAPTWSTRPTDRSWEGAVYVTFGGPAIGGADLAAPGTLRIEGVGENSQMGSVDCAGDVDADGIDDLVIGAWGRSQPGRVARGEAYVVFGARDLRTAGPLDVSLLGDRGYRITAPDAPEYDHLGYAVAGLGDVNRDGRDDLVVQANTADTTTATPPRTNNGITWVLPGQAGPRDVDVSRDALLTIHGAGSGQPNDVANVGDVNGDGSDDIGIGMYTAVYAGRSTASGAAYVVSGRRRGVLDLADPATALLFVGGPHAGQRLGTGIDAAGDVNGDGLGDVVIGADATSNANSDNAYVVFGAAEPSVLDASRLGASGYRILGMPGASSGYGVTGVGDVNGDGYHDVALGAYAAGDAGSAYVVYGVPDPRELPANDASSGLVPVNAADTTRYVALATLTPEQGSRLDGATAGERFGRQVAGVGDVDGNGAPDLAIGADMAFRLGRSGAGEVTVALLPGGAPAAEPEPDPDQPDGPAPGGPGPVAAPSGGTNQPTGRRPRLVVADRSVRAGGRFRVRFELRCESATAACRGRAVLTLAGRRRSARFTAAPGRGATVRVTLSRAQRRALKRKGALKGRLALTARAGGDTLERTLSVTVRAPKKRG
jgi:hypothetical protein